MGSFMNVIAIWMGWCLRFFYDLTLNYGLAIILFTIFIKIIMTPLNIKQQQSLLETQKIQPLVQEIQNKYKNDKQKQSEEMAKIYQEKKINPFGGCLLLIVQIPIIFAMFYAVQQPITYMFPEEKNEVVIQKIEEYKSINPTYKEVYYIAEQRKDLLNTYFLGINLAQVPSSDIKNLVLWIIPLLSGITTYFTSRISAKQSAGTGNEQTERMQKNMMMVLPIMTTYISFIVPLGMGLYWLVNNIVSVLIQIGVTKRINKTQVEKV